MFTANIQHHCWKNCSLYVETERAVVEDDAVEACGAYLTFMHEGLGDGVRVGATG